MKSENETLPVLTSTGLEIAWRYAWSGFLTFSILHHPFPLPVAVGAFAAAAFFTRLSGRRNWRRIQAAFLHLVGFTFAALLIAYRLFFRESQFFNGTWVADLILQPKAPQQWFILLLVLCCLLLFWLGGRSWEKRPRDRPIEYKLNRIKAITRSPVAGSSRRIPPFSSIRNFIRSSRKRAPSPLSN